MYKQKHSDKVAMLLSFDLPLGSACGDHFTNRYGIITFPGYSSMGNQPNSDCNWNISTPGDTKIVLEFLDFKLNCGNEYMKVTDLSNNEVLHKQTSVCDEAHVKEPLFSASNRINIHFSTYARRQDRGFKLVWKVKNILTWTSDFATWPEARAICNKNGGMLLTGVTDYKDEISQKMQERHVGQIWQGQYITPWVWLKGCFNFTNLDSLETVFVLKTNQMKECVMYCKNWNYFGLQEKKCFCFDTFVADSVVTETSCTTPCPGDNKERCGGNGSLTVYMNDVCFNNSREWRGTVSRTVYGNICVPWKNITAIAGNSSFVFPDGSAENASNYCRNPNGSSALWCYVGQDKIEFCDVPPCLNDGGKIDRCKTVYDNSNGLVFTTEICTSQKYYICTGVDTPYYVVTTYRTFQSGRQTYDNANCKSLVDSSIFFVDRNILQDSRKYWIGFFRDYATARVSDVVGRQDKCFIVSDIVGKLITSPIDCLSKRHFMCQTVPVTCGEQFDSFTNGNFSTPNYPVYYEALMHCIWTVILPEDHYMMLAIYTDMEDSPSCRYDYVKIYEGASLHDNQNTTLCGRNMRLFDFIHTNITIEFLSDETEASSGMFVSWTFVPVTPKTSTTITPPTQSRQEQNKQSTDDHIIVLSDGALAGIVVGIVFLLMLVCVGGFICGKRRRSPSSKDKNKNLTDTKSCKDHTSSNTLNLANMNNKNMMSENSLYNTGYEDDAINGVSPKGVKPSNVSPDKRVTDTEREQDNAGAIYSQVNKPRKGASTETNKMSPVIESNVKQKKSEGLYNALNENAENVYENKTENVYNCFKDSEPHYDCTTSSGELSKNTNVAPGMETYDRKK